MHSTRASVLDFRRSGIHRVRVSIPLSSFRVRLFPPGSHLLDTYQFHSLASVLDLIKTVKRPMWYQFHSLASVLDFFRAQWVCIHRINSTL